MQVDTARRNVIVSHQFIVGGTSCDSERRTSARLKTLTLRSTTRSIMSRWGICIVRRSRQGERHHALLRHAAGLFPIRIGHGKIRHDGKIGRKGEVSTHTVPLTPKRKVRLIRGAFDELMRVGPEKDAEDDYYFIELTDEEDVPNAAARLRERFANLLTMNYDNKRTRSFCAVDSPEDAAEKQPIELMTDCTS